jgi:hypothetical protein
MASPAGKLTLSPPFFRRQSVPISSSKLMVLDSSCAQLITSYRKVHTGIAKNKRQPYAVSEKAGEQTSAESWGTGMSCEIRASLSHLALKLNVIGQVVLLLVSPVFPAVVLTVLARLRLVTSVVLVVCSLRLRFGGNGTKRSILARSKLLHKSRCLETKMFP